MCLSAHNSPSTAIISSVRDTCYANFNLYRTERRTAFLDDASSVCSRKTTLDIMLRYCIMSRNENTSRGALLLLPGTVCRKINEFPVYGGFMAGTARMATLANSLSKIKSIFVSVIRKSD